MLEKNSCWSAEQHTLLFCLQSPNTAEWSRYHGWVKKRAWRWWLYGLHLHLLDLALCQGSWHFVPNAAPYGLRRLSKTNLPPTCRSDFTFVFSMTVLGDACLVPLHFGQFILKCLKGQLAKNLPTILAPLMNAGDQESLQMFNTLCWDLEIRNKKQFRFSDALLLLQKVASETEN